jgi:hypothetical protein
VYLDVEEARAVKNGNANGFDPGDWSALTNLRHVKLGTWDMKTAPAISQNMQLEVLDLNWNQLAALPDLTRLKNLQGVMINRNLFEVLPQLPPSIKYIYAMDNELVDVLSLQNLPNLEYVRLDSNLIDTKPFENAVPTGVELTMVGNPICDTYSVDDCGICELQCSPGCYMELMVNHVCDVACNVPECGFDQGSCDGAATLPCTEWCHSDGLMLFQLIDYNRDGVASGFFEIRATKSASPHPALDLDGAFVTMGLFCWSALDFGLAPAGSNCWGCDVPQLYQDQ